MGDLFLTLRKKGREGFWECSCASSPRFSLRLLGLNKHRGFLPMYATPQPSDDARLRLLFTASLPVCQDPREKRKGLSDTFLLGCQLSLIPRHPILTAARASLNCGVAGGVRNKRSAAALPVQGLQLYTWPAAPAFLPGAKLQVTELRKLGPTE